jgi:IS5 family transposase
VTPLTDFDNSTEPVACQSSEPESILVDELGEIFGCLPESELVAELGLYRWVGCSGYSIRAMLRAYLASYFLNMRNTNSLIRRLQEDIALREICGFPNSKPLPHRRTFNRFMDRLGPHQDLVQWCIDQMLSELHRVLPGFGAMVAVDATDIHSHSDCDRKPVSDQEAGFAIKEATTSHKKKWAWGYKLYLAVDVVYELPIGMAVTAGNTQEATEMMPLLRAMRARLPWFSPKYVIADKGYDNQKNFEGVVAEFDAEPIIRVKKEVPIFGSPARPFCLARLPLVYRGCDKDKGLRYQCPQRAGKATCPLPDKCPLKAIYIHPVHDYRRFGYRLPRNTEEWEEIYRRRTAIERVNSRLKEQRRLDSHCFRGLGKLEFHCRLAILSLLAGALAKARRQQIDVIRVCVRKIS